MRFVPKQCAECPFRRTSTKGWLGGYTIGEVFSSIWKGLPFFCHTTIDYEDKCWEGKAMRNGKLCTGGLLFAKKMLAPEHEIQHAQIASARLKVLKIENDVECMEPQEFGSHHDIRSQPVKRVRNKDL